MDGVSSSSSQPIAPKYSAQTDVSPVEQKAKSLGAPDNVIAQGPAAIKAWARENGILSSSGSSSSGSTSQTDATIKANNQESSNGLLRQIENGQGSYDRSGQTTSTTAQESNQASYVRLDILA